MKNLPVKMNFYCKEVDKDGVYHTFPVNIESNQETAENWASGSYRWSNDRGNPYEVFQYDNLGFKDVRITSLDKRGNGGRAYQVILSHDDKKFRVDLREEALMDVIKNTGIEKGGKLNGEFVFIIQGSQTNLVRKGSIAYLEAVEKSEERSINIIDKKDLKPGHLYRSLSGDTKLFIGEFYVKEIKEKEDKFIESKIIKKLLFLDLVDKTNDLIKDLQPKDFLKTYYSFYIDLKKNHSYRIDEGKFCEINNEILIKNLHFLAKYAAEKFLSKNHFSKYDIEDFKKIYQIASISENKEIVEWSDGLFIGNKMLYEIKNSWNRWY